MVPKYLLTPLITSFDILFPYSSIVWYLGDNFSYLIPILINNMVPRYLLTPLVTSFLQPCSGIVFKSFSGIPIIDSFAVAHEITIAPRDRGNRIGTRNKKPKTNFDISKELIFNWISDWTSTMMGRKWSLGEVGWPWL